MPFPQPSPWKPQEAPSSAQVRGTQTKGVLPAPPWWLAVVLLLDDDAAVPPPVPPAPPCGPVVVEVPPWPELVVSTPGPEVPQEDTTSIEERPRDTGKA
jgi:hypothetical protein